MTLDIEAIRTPVDLPKGVRIVTSHLGLSTNVFFKKDQFTPERLGPLIDTIFTLGEIVEVTDKPEEMNLAILGLRQLIDPEVAREFSNQRPPWSGRNDQLLSRVPASRLAPGDLRSRRTGRNRRTVFIGTGKYSHH